MHHVWTTAVQDYDCHNTISSEHWGGELNEGIEGLASIALALNVPTALAEWLLTRPFKMGRDGVDAVIDCGDLDDETSIDADIIGEIQDHLTKVKDLVDDIDWSTKLDEHQLRRAREHDSVALMLERREHRKTRYQLERTYFAICDYLRGNTHLDPGQEEYLTDRLYSMFDRLELPEHHAPEALREHGPDGDPDRE